MFAGSRCEALILKTWDGPDTPALVNTEPPADDPGWANLPTTKTGIYLGNGLVLSAKHAEGVGSQFAIAGGSFPIIPNSLTTLRNAESFGNRSQSAGNFDRFTDLWIYNVGLDTATGLSPEELDPSIRQIRLADCLPSIGTDRLTVIGRGAPRKLNAANPENGQTYYTSTGAVITDPAGWDASTYRGFPSGALPSPGQGVWQWGENYRSSTDAQAYSSNGNSLIDFQNDDTIGFAIRFDEGGGTLDDEVQAAGGDSGGPVFWKDGDEWVLAGLLHAITPAVEKTNSLNGAFGAHTFISDLSYATYRDQITARQGLFSVPGDLDLDGSVTGSIVNGDATGDLGILVDHLLEDSGTADIHSWMNGDLNQDGLTDLADFVIMRAALGGSISSSGFAQLVGAQSLPEPGAMGLVALGLLAALSRAVRRGAR